VEALSARRRIGLTGGIGSGKSTVAAALTALGAALIDTDAIARQITGAGGAAMAAVLREFGPEAIAPDGSLDRAAMRQRVFADQDARRRLEAILHPLIHAQAMREATAAATCSPTIVFDVPLLTESQRWRALVDRVLVVDCSIETQIDRVAQRPGWTRDAALRVIDSQAPRALRRSIADAVIFNDNITLAELQAHTEALWRLWNNSHPTI
jgi:dephospho-CoA kinase